MIRSWTGLRCRLSWRTEHIDAFVADLLTPLLNTHRDAMRIADWYFVRCWETGPHLRILFRDANPTTRNDIRYQLRGLVSTSDFPLMALEARAYYAAIGAPEDTPWYPHGDVREFRYEPQLDRYGGHAGMAVAEDLFCRGSEVAIAVLRTTDAKLTAAVEMAIATTVALGMDRPSAAAWLRMAGSAGRYEDEPPAPPGPEWHGVAGRMFAADGARLAERWEQGPTGATAYWAEHVRAARTRLPDHDDPRWLPVWAAQLHMLFNRLGIGPGEERVVRWLTAATALSPDGLTPFHDDGPHAPDRRYLAASRLLPGIPDQIAAGHTEPPPVRRSGGAVDLPAAAEPSGSLRSALRNRRTARGAELAGSLDRKTLASLLWTAHGVGPENLGTGRARRPYPSAGAHYCARLRLVARSVHGLDPGCYEVDEVSRALLPVGAAPSVADLEAMCLRFGPEGTCADPAQLARVPAVIGLYVRTGWLRRSYGLRALRFAFAEAGHLAQNLGLVAAALSVPLGLVGLFHDDVAHDVLGLDGVDDCLVYLIPVGPG